jgi:hypothetical protein
MHRDRCGEREDGWPVASHYDHGVELNYPSQPLGRALMHDVPSADPSFSKARRQSRSSGFGRAFASPCDHPVQKRLGSPKEAISSPAEHTPAHRVEDKVAEPAIWK